MNLKKNIVESWQFIWLSALMFIGLAYMLVSGTNSSNFGLISISIAFTILWIGGIIALLKSAAGIFSVSFADVMSRAGNNFTQCLSFLVGFIGMLALSGGVKFSLVNVYSTAIVGLDQFFSTFIVTVAAPIAEETFFLLGFFLVFSQIFKQLGANVRILSFLANSTVQTILITIISAVAFAFYHTSEPVLSAFIISAMVFRAVILGLAEVDAKLNLVPYLDTTLLFAIGVHMANNIAATVGITQWIAIMSTNVIGFGVLLYFVLVGISIIDPIIRGVPLSRLLKR